MATIATLEGLLGLGRGPDPLAPYLAWLRDVGRTAPSVLLHVGPGAANTIQVDPAWVEGLHRAIAARVTTGTLVLPRVHRRTAAVVLRDVLALTGASLDGLEGLQGLDRRGHLLGLGVAALALLWASRRTRVSRSLRLALLGGVVGTAGSAAERMWPGIVGATAAGALVAVIYTEATRAGNLGFPRASTGRAAIAGGLAGFGGAQVARRLAEAPDGTATATLQTALGSLVGGAAVVLTTDGLLPPELKLDGGTTS